MAEALKTNTELQFLSLSGNAVGDEGATVLAEALKVNNVLQMLWMGSSQVRYSEVAVVTCCVWCFVRDSFLSYPHSLRLSSLHLGLA